MNKKFIFGGALVLSFVISQNLVTAQTIITIAHDPQPTALSVVATNDVGVCPGGSTVLGSTPAGGTSPYSYSWTPTGSLSSSTNDTTTASPSSNQTYTITVTDDRNCTSTDNVTVTILDCSGVEQLKEVQALNLYPIPTDGILNFGLTFTSKQSNTLVQIFNSNGQLVMSKNYTKPDMELKDVFDLSSASPGNYMFRITIGNNSMTKSFIVK
jgi:hypothetical protein